MPYETQNQNINIFQENQANPSFNYNYTQPSPYSTYPTIQSTNMQNNMRQMAALMQTNNNNFNQNQSNESASNSNVGSSDSSSGGYNVVFRASGQGGNSRPPLTIQCMPNEKVSELIERYRTKSGDRDPTKKFIYNAKKLNMDLTISDAGITNNANIFVVTTEGVRGAY